MKRKYTGLYVKPTVPLELSLSEDSLTLSVSKTSKLSIPIKELIGCTAYRPLNKNFMPRLEIFYTVKEYKKYNKFGLTELEDRKLKNTVVFGKDIEVIRALRCDIMNILYKAQKINCKLKTDVQTDNPYYRKAIVFVNPVSGKKKSEKVFHQYRHLFEANGILIEVIKTTSRLFTQDYIHSLDKSKLLSFNLIICFSGDGIVHHILNGFFKRNDIDFKKEHLTVVLMPTGTGCALTENCMKNKGKVTSFNNVIHSICHSNRKAFPVAKYDYLTDKKQKGSFFCFINVTHGYPCEVVLNSEKLRFLERKRIYLYGIYEYIFLKAYKTKITYPKAETDTMPSIEQEARGDRFVINNNPTSAIFVSELPYCATEYRGFPLLLNKPIGISNLHIIEKQLNRKDFLKFCVKHLEHEPGMEIGIVEALKKSFRLEFDPEPEKRKIMVDGENYSNRKARMIQKNSETFQFYSLI